MQHAASILLAAVTRNEPTTLDAESIIATLILAQRQIERDMAWSASEIIGEAIRELAGQPLQIQ